MSVVEQTDEIFDASRYDLPIPKDPRGRKADKMTIGIGGSLEFDRTSEEDLDLINGLRDGSVTEVVLRASVAGETWTYAEDEDGNVEPRYQVRLKVYEAEAADR